ncbi:MAG: type I DNA topoisomerase [Myxococcota bacterium]|jgi:DNA topoisomerase-1|nr:type I DNA topoisomerase [Myxococcota bacterium]
MAKSLLVVESPAKAKTLKRYLGDGFEVAASVGHVKDLPKTGLGVDIENSFQPEYVTISGKGKVLSAIKKLARAADIVYLAPDPDREGEAIAWHLAEEIGYFDGKAPKTYRVMINEITQRGVTEALAKPTTINKGRYESQQTRRILDRLVGYQISPILWDKVRRGLSAGRVQSVAVRLVVDRERDVRAFEPQEYWNIKARLGTSTPPVFWTSLHQISRKEARVVNEAQAKAVVEAVKGGAWVVRDVVTKERARQPAPPFTTSKLQQEAARKLRFSSKLTMSVAQRLYEGIDIGEEGAVGLITYMRTDSTRLSNDAVGDCRDYISATYGPAYLPANPAKYKSKKGAQDAHEAIRPTHVQHTPEALRPFLSSEQYRLYKLIWQRFVACQMASAIFDQTRIDVANGSHLFRAVGAVQRFAGFLLVYEEGRDDQAEEEDAPLPPVQKGDKLELLELSSTQHFTTPPPRFTEATLVKELEERGIGRPSTYASIISVIQEKGYVEKRSGRFHPTELGSVVTELLVENFPQILDVEFTANMESQLDRVEGGTVNWVELLSEFYGPFARTLQDAQKNMRNLKAEATPTEVICDKCGAVMNIRWGRNGSFLACSRYPECKRSMEFQRTDEGVVVPIENQVETRGTCPDCGHPMLVKAGRFGRFVACSNYPSCRHTEPLSSGAPCPREGCDGELLEKRSKRGKVFFGCNRYPDCDYATWNRPLEQDCPACGQARLEESVKREGVRWLCPVCGHSQTPDGEAEGSADAAG